MVFPSLFLAPAVFWESKLKMGLKTYKWYCKKQMYNNFPCYSGGLERKAITGSEQLPCAHATAFSQTTLKFFRSSFPRMLNIKSVLHISNLKPETRKKCFWWLLLFVIIVWKYHSFIVKFRPVLPWYVNTLIIKKWYVFDYFSSRLM